MGVIGVERLSAEVSEQLGLYSQELKSEISDITKKYATELVKETKATAPTGNRNGNKYRDSIKCKKQSETLNGISYLWYVDSKDSNYRLTHLLVNGHATRDGGRTQPNDFLEKALSKVSDDFIKAIEEAIQNGQ